MVHQEQVWQSDVVTKVRPPSLLEAESLGPRMLISLVQPAQNPAVVETLRQQGSTVLGLDQLPRTLSRGQVGQSTTTQGST
jgi:NAD/NADP transhydrogenase alpha subunit